MGVISFFRYQYHSFYDNTLAGFLDGKTIYISFITQLELLSYSQISPDEEERIEHFLSQCIVTDINTFIKHETFWLRKCYRLKLPDSIDMATSLYHELPLVTSDRELTKVEELQVQGVGTDESTAFLGDFSKVLWGIRQAAQIEVTTVAGDAFTKHQVLIKITWRGDINFEHPEHLVKLTGITA